MEGVAREKERLLSRLEAKEREVGGLATKASLSGDGMRSAGAAGSIGGAS
jgi:hypothetical protein